MFNILANIQEELTAQGFNVLGIAKKPLRIDFANKDSLSKEDRDRAISIARDMIDNEATHRATWKASRKSANSTPALVDLLVRKRIITEQEAASLSEDSP